MPQLQQDMARRFTFQQDASPPHPNTSITKPPNLSLMWNLFGFDEADQQSGHQSPDLTHLEFCLWGYMKDAVYVPSPLQQPYISYVHKSQMQSLKLMQMCLGGYRMK
jgi:hypothetical protein